MDTFLRTLAKKHSTKKTGIYYKEIQKTTIDEQGKSKVSINDKVYYIRYKDENKKDIWIAIGKYSEGIRENYCNQKRIEALNQIKLGEQPEIIKKKQKREILTLDDIFQIYKTQKQSENKDLIKTEQKYNSNIFKKFGHIDITAITTDEIVKFKKSLIDKDLSGSTINWNIGFIGTLFNISIEDKIYTKLNPIKDKKLKAIKLDNARDRYLTKKEIKKLYKSVSSDESLNMFVCLSLTTGGRLETILNMQKKDIDFDNHSVKLKDLKNNSTYSGFLTKDIISLLKKNIKELSANSFIVGREYTKYATRTLQRKLKTILDTLFNDGLDTRDTKNRVVIHTLRHTFASHLAINGTSIYVIQRLMNHSDIKMTLRYAKLAPDSGKIDVQGLYK